MIKRDDHRSLEIVSPIEISSTWSSVSFINEKINKQTKILKFPSRTGKSDFT